MPERQTGAISTEAQSPQGEGLAEVYGISQCQSDFLTEYLHCGNVSEAANRAGIHRHNHYQALRYSEGYQKAYADIRRAIGSRIVEVMAERAIQGDCQLYNGEIVTDPETGQPIRKHDTILQIFLAKSIGGLSDQPKQDKQSKAGPEIHIYLPEQSNNVTQPVIELNQAEDTPTIDDDHS